jgi:3' terminal RNA ribose 2'-O-methyltransferase Hen1
MLLSVTTTHVPATDLGYLLAKNPARAHTFELPAGRATVFFPEAGDTRCTAVLHVEVDVVGLVRAGRAVEDAPLARYVNDRPYAASSLLSVALARVFGSAMGGRCRERPELAASGLPLALTIVALPCRGGETVVRRLFEPLGWTVEVAPVPFPPGFAAAAAARTFDVTLRGSGRLADLLTHVYVLVPVLDDQKHYWIGDDEVEKLLTNGGAWLATHPDRELVVQRYLGHHRSLVDDALARLSDGEVVEDESPPGVTAPEERLEAPLRLVDQRYDAVLRVLRERSVRSVCDLGCGEGKLLARLARVAELRSVLGVEVSAHALERARARLDRLPASAAEKVQLLLGSALYRDPRLAEVEALVLVEVIEHLEPERLGDLEDVVFVATRPRVVVATTPNAEFNVRFEDLAPGAFRHRDHRFEWDRATFRAWASAVAVRCGYAVRFEDVGPVDDVVGAPTQLAEWTR